MKHITHHPTSTEHTSDADASRHVTTRSAAGLAEVWHDIGRPNHDRPANDHEQQLVDVLGDKIGRLANHPAAQAGLRRCLRTAATALRRIADARVQTLLDSGQDLKASDPEFEAVLVALWRDQLARSINAATVDDSHGRSDCAIGFIDLAGYSARSQQLPTDQLVELIDRFDSAAATITARHGATLIKTIGDEIMYRHHDPVAAAKVAADFLEHCADDSLLLNARAGIAWGTPVEVAGDLYGPAVNLAARLVQLARPNTILIDAHSADLLADHPEFERKQLRPQTLRGCGTHAPTALRRSARGSTHQQRDDHTDRDDDIERSRHPITTRQVADIDERLADHDHRLAALEHQQTRDVIEGTNP